MGRYFGDHGDFHDEDDYPDDEMDSSYYYRGIIEHETDKAVLFARKNEAAEWIPKSQIVKREDDALYLTPWIVEQKGWEASEEEIPF